MHTERVMVAGDSAVSAQLDVQVSQLFAAVAVPRSAGPTGYVLRMQG